MISSGPSVNAVQPVDHGTSTEPMNMCCIACRLLWKSSQRSSFQYLGSSAPLRYSPLCDLDEPARRRIKQRLGQYIRLFCCGAGIPQQAIWPQKAGHNGLDYSTRGAYELSHNEGRDGAAAVAPQYPLRLGPGGSPSGSSFGQRLSVRPRPAGKLACGSHDTAKIKTSLN